MTVTAITDAQARARLAWIKAAAAQAASIAESGLRFGPAPAAAAADAENDHPARMERVIEDESDVFERTRGDVWRDIFAGE